jgi:hypothetical protein
VKKYQRELEEVEERADAAQSEADKLKSRLRIGTTAAARTSASDGDDAVCSFAVVKLYLIILLRTSPAPLTSSN